MTSEFTAFLTQAKISTYATEGEANEELLPDGAKRLTFSRGNYTYTDTYYGFSPFSGMEIVHKDDTPYWSMTYYGKIMTGIDPKQLYAFLQKALRAIPEDIPFRGPNLLKDGEWEYKNEPEGSVEDCKGRERIFYKGEQVFALTYQGGLVK